MTVFQRDLPADDGANVILCQAWHWSISFSFVDQYVSPYISMITPLQMRNYGAKSRRPPRTQHALPLNLLALDGAVER
jgi:hypothetical protein